MFADVAELIEQRATPSFAEQMVTATGHVERPLLVKLSERSSLVAVTLVECRTDWLVDTLQKLAGLASLPVNWDGCDSTPPAEVAVECARDILQQMAKIDFAPDAIDATCDGGICISFRSDARYADIESFANGEILAVVAEKGGTPEVWPLTLASQEIANSLNRIRGYLA